MTFPICIVMYSESLIVELFRLKNCDLSHSVAAMTLLDTPVSSQKVTSNFSLPASTLILWASEDSSQFWVTLDFSLPTSTLILWASEDSSYSSRYLLCARLVSLIPLPIPSCPLAANNFGFMSINCCFWSLFVYLLVWLVIYWWWWVFLHTICEADSTFLFSLNVKSWPFFSLISSVLVILLSQ